MSTPQRLAVEDLFIERMDNARAVFVLSRQPIVQASAWWSKSLLSRIDVNNVEIGISDSEQE